MLRRLALAAAAIVLAACATAPGGLGPIGGPSPSAAATGNASPTVKPAPTLPAGVAKVIKVSRLAYGIESAGETVWAEGYNVLYQLDGASGETLQELPGYGPAVVDGTLWYRRGDELVAADAATGAERAVYQPPHLGSRAVDDDTLWVASERRGTLAKIDLATNEVLGELELPPGEPKWVEYWEGAVWVVIDGSDVVVRVDPESVEVIDTIDAGIRPHSVEVAFGSLWVTEHGTTELLRLARDGTVQATIPGPGINVAVTAAGDFLWAAAPGGVMQIDPSNNEVVGEVKLGPGDWYALAASGAYLWLSTGERGDLLQIPLP